jgi:hypothetical protein
VLLSHIDNVGRKPGGRASWIILRIETATLPGKSRT